jgi:hypothetical protein
MMLQSSSHKEHPTDAYNIFSGVNANISLTFYCEMKHERGKGSHIDKCTRKERIKWLKAGIWKLRGIGRGLERGRCHLCLGEGKEDIAKMVRDKKKV